MSPIDNANMYGAITRAELAKMLANWAKDKGQTPDTSVACNFTDTASVKGDLAVAIVESCQLGLMGQGISAFRPYDTISRAEFGTALSRALWGNQYEGGTPYYAKHLDALKAAGIMTQIANAESTKEVRGYVMLMLMRSEGNEAVVDCDDPMTVIACTTNTDACPAACRENAGDNTDTVVKAGDLAVTAKPAADRKVIVPTEGDDYALSDTDTLSFKSSEEVSITKVTLERYGYSSNDGIKVSLEDENGNVIAEPKALDSKGQAKLSIKKDYRAVDGSLNATVVVSATSALKVGSTIGFKVIAVESSAENLNLDNYKPYTYDVVAYDGSQISFTVRWASKEYNYEAGKSYEIAKFQVKAPADTAILARGFTLKNDGELDLNEFLDKVTVTFDGEKVDGLKYNTNKNKELIISFDEVEIAAKKNGTFVVNMTLADDFDEYNKAVHAYIASYDKFSAVDKKTESRVRISNDMEATSWAESWPTYTFKGGKIKITNTKLGRIEAAYGSEDVVVAEGKVTTSESLDNGTFKIKVNNAVVKSGNDNLVAIEKFTMYVNGEEYDANKDKTVVSYTDKDNNYAEFTFEGVEIEESGKIQFKVDLVDSELINNLEMSFSSFGSFTKLEYVESNTSAKDEVSGSISFSKLKVQPAKAALKNNLDKDQEFIKGESERKVIFDGTYTAKKGDVTLTEFVLSKSATAADAARVTFYVTVGDEEADADATFNSTDKEMRATNTLNDIVVKNGESVKVVVEAEVDWNGTGSLGTYTLALHGEDDNGIAAGNAQAKAKAMKVVEEGSVKVEAGSSSKTVLYKASRAVLAQFTVKPSNADTVDIESITFDLKDGDKVLKPSDLDVTLEWGNDGDSLDSDDDTKFDYSLNETAQSAGIAFKVVLNEEYNGTLAISNLKVNNKAVSKEFVNKFENAVVRIISMDNNGGTTTFHFDVEADNDVDVSDLTLTFDGNKIAAKTVEGDIDSTTTLEVAGIADTPVMVSSISYRVADENVGGKCDDNTTTDKTECEAKVKTPAEEAQDAKCAAPYELNGDSSACVASGTLLAAAFDAGSSEEVSDNTCADPYVLNNDGTGCVADGAKLTAAYTEAKEAKPATYYKWTPDSYRTVTIYKEKTWTEPGFPDFFKVRHEGKDLNAQVFASNSK